MLQTPPNTVPVLRSRSRGRHRPAFEPAILKTASLVLLVLLLAIGGGTFSVWLMLEKAPHFGILQDGPWISAPAAGTRQADPYSRARFIRTGGIPLGNAEGITFSAQTDSDGRTLRRECTYRVEGPLPIAFVWTLYAADPAGALLPSQTKREAAIHSRMILRDQGNAFSITASPHPAPGNWLALSGTGQMRLVLTLFDTPIAASDPFEELALPQILRVGCDA